MSRESAAYRGKHLGLVSEEDLLALDWSEFNLHTRQRLRRLQSSSVTP